MKFRSLFLVINVKGSYFDFLKNKQDLFIMFAPRDLC